MENEEDIEKKEMEQSEPQMEESVADKEATSKHDKKRRHEKHDDSEAKVQEMGEKLAEMNDKYLRVTAEYENYRKRTAKEKQDLILNGGKDVIKSVLPVVDDLERALAAFADDDPSKEGVQLIFNKLMNTLGQKGLKLIEAKGVKFDENLHEAVTQIPAPTPELKGCVVDVVEKGYFLNESVLRYPKVVVGI